VWWYKKKNVCPLGKEKVTGAAAEKKGPGSGHAKPLGNVAPAPVVKKGRGGQGSHTGRRELHQQVKVQKKKKRGQAPV